jgi:hypothetical protein
LGIGYSYTYRGGRPLDGPPAADPTERVEFRQRAGGGYDVLLPGYEPGQLRPTSYNGSYNADGWITVGSTYNKVTRGDTDETQNVEVTLQRPAGPLNPSEKLRYTSFGEWNRPSLGIDGPETGRRGNFAYGVPTAAGDVPVAGSATYRADIRGSTTVTGTGASATWPEFVTGTAELRFDFGAGTLAGHMQPEVCPWDCYALGRYEFRDTVYARGATGFSGSFEAPDAGPGGFFEGTFTGPGAAELLARFQAAFKHPETGATGNLFGVWVGKRD